MGSYADVRKRHVAGIRRADAVDSGEQHVDNNMSMTISQALRRIKAVKGEYAEYLQRANASVSFREGREPGFKFESVLERLNGLRRELIKLQSQLAVTNAVTAVTYNGRRMPLAEAVLTAKELRSSIAFFGGLPVRAQKETVEDEFDYSLDKTVRLERKYICALPEEARTKVVETLREEFAVLNDIIEEANRVTSLHD